MTKKINSNCYSIGFYHTLRNKPIAVCELNSISTKMGELKTALLAHSIKDIVNRSPTSLIR